MADGRAGSDNPLRWYALYTRPRHEKKVACQLTYKGVDHFLPLWRVRRRWSDRWKEVAFPLFPNYLFVRLNLEDVRRYTAVLRTPGVVGLVRFNGRVEPVPDEEVESVRRICESSLPYDPFPYLQEGRWVEIVRGPLKGLRGWVVEREGTYQVVVSVHILQRSVAVKVSPMDLQPL
jgi:transcription antitermination factor NusG